MTKQKISNKYDIDKGNDYVVVIKPNGINEFYVPEGLDTTAEEGYEVDPRFVASTFVLRDRGSFETTITRFKTYMQEAATQQQAEAQTSTEEVEDANTEE